jgi:hypothetical protein
MLILFGQVTPTGIARFLPGHTVIKAKDRGWDTLTNGKLLSEAERAGFDLLLIADKNMRFHQNLAYSGLHVTRCAKRGCQSGAYFCSGSSCRQGPAARAGGRDSRHNGQLDLP